MQSFLVLGLILALLLIAYQDMKLRLIHAFLPVGIFILALTLKWNTLAWKQWTMSLLFVVLNLVAVTVYFSLRNRKWVNVFDTLIGWGDVLLLLGLIPLFSFRGYLIFFTGGMIFSLLLFGILRTFDRKYSTVPLAGHLSIFVIGILLIDHLTLYGFII